MSTNRRVKDPVSGFTHLAGAVLALFGAAWLVVRSGPGEGLVASAWVYGACLVGLFAASATYHLVVASERTTRTLRLVDHASIFLMVAGTCTPIFYRAFSGSSRIAALSIIWGTAAAGLLFKLLWRNVPRWAYTSVYLAMGWGVVLCGPALFASLPVAVCTLVVGGGLAYTCGAVIYATRRPNPFPGVFGFHEIWHLFVMGGSALHYAAIALIV